MTSISATSSAASSTTFGREIFSSPEMRPYLEDYYESIYAPMRERIAGMKEAEAKGQAPRTVSLPDGTTATELCAAQYEAVIPSFDKWLELQQNFSVFDQLEQSASWAEQARQAMDRVETSLDPDRPSGVRTVFSDGNRILGYINEDGGLVVADPASGALQDIAERANALNFTGEARIAYLRRHGAAELSRLHPNLTVTDYTAATMPTRREFARSWYPSHDVDAAYESALQDIRVSLEEREAWHRQQMQNLNAMRAFLIQAQCEETAAGA